MDTYMDTKRKLHFPKMCYNTNGFRPVGAAVARSLDMGKVIGSIPILGTIFNRG